MTKIRLLYLLELQILDNQKLAITASEISPVWAVKLYLRGST